MTIGKKMYLYFGCCSLIPFIVMAVIAYNNASRSLRKQAESNLVAVREIKRNQINDRFTSIKNDIISFSANSTVIQAMGEFSNAFSVVGDKQVRDLYIFKNSHPVGEKLKLMDAGDNSDYTYVHKMYHPLFKDFLERYGYYDIFLIDSKTGDIVYTVFKEDDFGTNLLNGKYAKDNIAAAFSGAKASDKPDFVKLADLQAYAPSHGAAASFISSPIYNRDMQIGVLVFQINIKQIDIIMQEKSGMGESGETYLVGEDLFARSNSRFAENMVLKQKTDTESARAALGGETGFTIMPNYSGTPVLSAYTPVGLEGVNWVLMAEISEAEAFAPVYALRNWALIIGGIIAAIVATVLFLVTSQITRLLKGVISNLAESSEQVALAAEQISASSQSLAEGSSEQASSLEETSASMEEMASMTQQTADNSKEATQLASLCNLTAESGNKSVNDMNVAMQAINGSSKKIGDIIKVIDGIAFQTNLLALNAAVEAARAGEHGKGFAVVAEEVRNLAQRSATAAKDTTVLIEDCVSKADAGTKLSEKCKEVLTDIVTNVKKVSNLINEISTASSEQSGGIDQVCKAVQQMDQITQQNAASAEETASASEEMSAQAQQMMEQIGILSAQVGGGNDAVTSQTRRGDIRQETHNKPARINPPVSRYKKQIPGRIEESSVYYDRPTSDTNGNGNGNRKNAIPRKTDPEAIIPMNKNEVEEHDDKQNDF
ncbi:MAG: methyl-accepting chemotaxis protein [Candidatus Brocadiaceae bacterium]|nr:methyl-accepting chemotaxis protein [Candidatus Brocadiaceae bacterium]